MERELLQRETALLNGTSTNGVNHESSLYDKVNQFFKQTAIQFPGTFIRLLLSQNKRESMLTDAIFFDRHRDRNGRKINRRETKLIREWLAIRRVIVRPILQYLYGKQTNVTKLNSKEVFEDIERHLQSWIDAYIVALDDFKFITEKATDDELKKLKGVTPTFLYEVTQEVINTVSDFASNVPVLGTVLKVTKAALRLASLVDKYKERQAQYQALKNKNDLIDYVVSEKEFFSNLKITLNANYRELSELFVPMMNKDKFIRATFENKYLKTKALAAANQNELFKQVCEKWIQQFSQSVLRIVFNKEVKVISTILSNVPFGKQIMSKIKRSSEGLNLQSFHVNRLVVFYPYDAAEPQGFADKNANLRYEFIKSPNGEWGKINQLGFWGQQTATPETYNKVVALSLNPLPVVKE